MIGLLKNLNKTKLFSALGAVSGGELRKKSVGGEGFIVTSRKSQVESDIFMSILFKI